ncbi:adhesion G protein-coupled receptor L3-like [Oculina patagonica]
MKKTSMTELLLIGTLLIFLQGVSISVQYHFFPDELNYTEAHEECQGDYFKYLAQINKQSQLSLAKNSSSYNQTKKYWTGLQIKDVGYTKWKWSDGQEFSPRPEGLENILNVSFVKNLVRNGPIKVYCFLVSSNEKLEMENCSEKYPYICEEFKGPPTTSTASKSTQIRPTTMATPLMSEVTATFTSKVTDTSKIRASNTLSVSTHVSTSISPTQPPSPEEQVATYLIKMKKLSVSDGDSLQLAANETSKLLTHFQYNSYQKTTVNLLLASQQLETFAIKYAKKRLSINSTFNSSTTNIGKHFVMEVQSVIAGDTNNVNFPSKDDWEQPLNHSSEKIFLPAGLFKKKETVVVGILYKDMHKLLPDESQYFLDGKKLENTKLHTRIIACAIYPSPSGLLPQNVTISFTLEEPSKADDTPHCVFWDFNITSRFNGSWSNRGCTLVNKTKNNIVCSCNHLTNFAVLMQVGETKIADKHHLALEIITYIGCGLSLVGETFTVLVYLVLMNIKQEQCQIRLNLVIAIAVAQIIFLAGIDATSKQEACIFVAVSIHYFYLVGFAWMLMEGIYLYLMVVKVFNTLVKIKLFYAFSWGFPLLMVVCSIVIASITEGGVMSYVHSDFCWVSFTNNLVWTFAAPVLLICLVNSFILCRVVYEMTKMQGSKDVSNVKQGLKACAVLFPLLGMTWVFGILTVTDAGLVFQYIFTTLNSLQGFFIFVMHVLRSSEVHNAYLRKKQKWENTKNSNFPNSRSVVENSSTWPEKHAMANLHGSKESPDPLFRRHQVSPITSDRMDTRESCITPVEL